MSGFLNIRSSSFGGYICIKGGAIKLTCVQLVLWVPMERSVWWTRCYVQKLLFSETKRWSYCVKRTGKFISQFHQPRTLTAYISERSSSAQSYWLEIQRSRDAGSIVVKALCCKPEGGGLEIRWSERIFPIYLILPAAVDPGVYSASNRNEYQKQKNFSGE
jgi:hypothetical protein